MSVKSNKKNTYANRVTLDFSRYDVSPLERNAERSSLNEESFSTKSKIVLSDDASSVLSHLKTALGSFAALASV